MTRALNALLYRRFDQARRHQVDSANLLQQVASKLGEAAKHLPAISREELLEALNRLQKSSREVQEVAQKKAADAQQKLDQIQQRVAQQLDPLAATLQDPTLQRVGDELAMPMGTNDIGEGSRRLLQLFGAAAVVLERQLFAAEMQRRLGLSRMTSLPPEKYRRLVEEYFKDLSQTK